MAKVKTDFRKAKKDIERFKREARQRLKPTVESEITKSIERGISPVKGIGRFVKYSTDYLKQIRSGRYSRYGKAKRPVNLKLTGDLLKSLKVILTKRGLSISFDNKLADIHNRKGAGQSKTVRRMLPTNNGEEFSRSITMRWREVVSDVARKIFK